MSLHFVGGVKLAILSLTGSIAILYSFLPRRRNILLKDGEGRSRSHAHSSNYASTSAFSTSLSCGDFGVRDIPAGEQCRSSESTLDLLLTR